MRAGVDSTAIEAQFNYTNRANAFQKTGGATFLSTFFDVLPPQNLLPSTYQVRPIALVLGNTPGCAKLLARILAWHWHVLNPCACSRVRIPPRNSFAV